MTQLPTTHIRSQSNSYTVCGLQYKEIDGDSISYRHAIEGMTESAIANQIASLRLCEKCKQRFNEQKSQK